MTRESPHYLKAAELSQDSRESGNIDYHHSWRFSEYQAGDGPTAPQKRTHATRPWFDRFIILTSTAALSATFAPRARTIPTRAKGVPAAYGRVVWRCSLCRLGG